jgi:DNA-binding GntR family transcriptional regulator
MEDPRLSRRIHAALVERIASGTYPAGTRIHIGLLTQEFSTTRTTVGKALRLLSDEGRVEYFSGLGWYVKEAPASE